MEFINGKADPAMPDPYQANASAIEARYRELALRAAIWPGDPRSNNPQLYFEKLPPELPTEFPLAPGTRLLGSLVRNAQDITLYLDSTLTNKQVIEFYTGRLTAAGWSKVDPLSMPGLNAGFMAGTRRMQSALFCQGSQGPSLNLQTNSYARDVRIEVNLDTANSPCDQSRRQRFRAGPLESPLPNLTPPPGNTQNFDGGGSGGNYNSWTSSATLDTGLDLAALAAHYNSQLERAAWQLSGQGLNGPVAWSQWTLKDKEGEEWQGFFLIYQDFARPSHHFLHLKVEKAQTGSANSPQNSRQLRF